VDPHDLIIRYISALGFPIVAAMAMAWVLYKIGGYLVLAHTAYLEDNTREMKKQTAALDKINETLPHICKAQCPAASECENYKPRGRK
jgi:hypothetical protein